jgi:hypothetical protein
MERSILLVLSIGFLFLSAKCFGQTTLPTPRNIQAAYQKGTRSKDGSPGKDYWQNRADYNVHVNFTPKSRLLAGSEIITYDNNSPDTLHQIWFKLYPNLYKKGASRNSGIHPDDITHGVHIEKMAINGKTQNAQKRRIRGTNMIVGIPGLPPHQTMKFKVVFSYTVNRHTQIRTGEVEPGAYFIAYFFPRITVYDDINGWDKFPYNGEQEFYNDFCNFAVHITVPENYVIWATGKLQNGSEVLGKKYMQSIKKAETHDDITTIIDTTDLKTGGITANHPTNTWHFKAKNVVTEFAFGASNHYVWKSSSLVVDPKSGRRTRVDAVFNPKHKDYQDVIHFARKTVKAMSYKFPAWSYPYPHETVFDGLSQMEYPMMVNDNPLKNRAESIELTDHEIFHTMFPFYMGTNETKYAWMDEGWATIAEWLISPMIDSSLVDYYGMQRYDHFAGTESDLPIMTPSTQENGIDYYLNSYPKPAMGYLYVKDMLGNKLFLKGLHHYIKLWHGKHPMPYDFFYCMNKGTGKNLNWFWKRWFFERGFPDQAIKSVKKHGKKYQMIIKSIGSKPVPVDLTVAYKNGTVQKIHRTIAVWKNGNRTVTISFKPRGKMKKITLGAPHDADIDSTNNTFVMH